MTLTETEARRGAAIAADLAVLERLAGEMKDGKHDAPGRGPDSAQVPSDPPATPPEVPPPGDPVPPPPPMPDPPPPSAAVSAVYADELAEIDRLIRSIDAARSGGDIPPVTPPGTPPGDLPPGPLPDPAPDPGPLPMPDPGPGPGPDQTPGPAMAAPAPEITTLAADLAAISAEVAALKLRLAEISRPAAPEGTILGRDPIADVGAITAWVETLALHWPANVEPPKALKTLVFGAGLLRGMLPPATATAPETAPATPAAPAADTAHPAAPAAAEGVGRGPVPPVTPTAAAEGRAAETPAAIPAAGWRRVSARVWAQIWEDRVLAVAAGVAFYALLSLFPAITALVSIFGLFADRTIVLQNLAQLDHLLPPAALQLIRLQLDALLSTDPATLTFATALSLALGLWTANGGMKAMIEALNVAYGERERRNFFVLNLWSLTMTLGGIVMVIFLLGLSAALPPVLERLPTTFAADRIMLALRWPAMLAVLVMVLALLYRFGPSREGAKWRWIGPGTVVAALLLIVASAGFSFYAANFGSYDATYGSLGAVVVLMIWAWISAIVVLLGAEINSEAERQTARDTTTGQPRAMGRRGAFSADTLGR
ncbi:YihY/virulence factor BrkB family protein [Frigidibacter sp. MR17.24]|uniref:YihY/virulence factor BrkB family protein n=1 Tax=Frigidibacter sp. MR17.24 TaxID=3127345 RepID=UPI003012B408